MLGESKDQSIESDAAGGEQCAGADPEVDTNVFAAMFGTDGVDADELIAAQGAGPVNAVKHLASEAGDIDELNKPLKIPSLPLAVLISKQLLQHEDRSPFPSTKPMPTPGGWFLAPDPRCKLTPQSEIWACVPKNDVEALKSVLVIERRDNANRYLCTKCSAMFWGSKKRAIEHLRMQGSTSRNCTQPATAQEEEVFAREEMSGRKGGRPARALNDAWAVVGWRPPKSQVLAARAQCIRAQLNHQSSGEGEEKKGNAGTDSVSCASSAVAWRWSCCW